MTPAQAFEDMISHLHTNERVARIKEKAEEVARKYGWEDAFEKIRKKNPGRKIYYNKPTKTFYSVDTYHGRFEMQNIDGKHLCEVDFDLRQTSGPTPGHDLNV